MEPVPDLNALTGEEAVRAARARWRTGQLVEVATRMLQRSGFEAMSMQALASEAGVSVGLIYRYFRSKEDVLVAIVTDVLAEFARRVPQAMSAAGDDPVERLAAGFRAYCEVIDERHHAALLTYQQGRMLGAEALGRIEALEVECTRPLADAVRAGVSGGMLVARDPDLAVYDMVLLAHAWALKHWYFRRWLDFERYVAQQTAFVLRSLVASGHRERYAHLLKPGTR
jgi:AcrR family transcriptional regulator